MDFFFLVHSIIGHAVHLLLILYQLTMIKKLIVLELENISKLRILYLH